MLKTLANKLLNKAIKKYEKQMQSYGKSAVFTKQQHEQLLQNALNPLSSVIKAELFKEIAQHLREKCTKIWKRGHERCHYLSLFGNLCRLPVHNKTNNFFHLRNHISGVKFLSTCNCGKTQLIRVDPFTLKEANYDFYKQREYFKCCDDLDKFYFNLFDFDNKQLEKKELSQEKIFGFNSEFDEDEIGKEIENESDDLKTSSSSSIEYDFENFNVIEENENLKPEKLEDEDIFFNPLEYTIGFFDENKEKLKQNKEKKKYIDKKTLRCSRIELDNEEDEYEEGNDDEEDLEDIAKSRKTITEEDDLKAGLLKIKFSESEEQNPGHYLDNYDSHLTRRQSPTFSKLDDDKIVSQFARNFEILQHKCKKNLNSHQIEQIEENFKDKYLDYVPFFSYSNKCENLINAKNLLPLFPSWSIVCVGSSHIYNHLVGLRNQPNFKNGYPPFLLPWEVHLIVKTEQWQKDVKAIYTKHDGNNEGDCDDNYMAGRRRQRRGLEEATTEGTNREKVKLFIGFDYECPRGHRFFIQSSSKALKYKKVDGLLTLDAGKLIATDLPIWMPCTCQRKPRQVAQLMRLHVVTPKAPIFVQLNPKIEFLNENGYFHFGNNDEPINLSYGKYYVLRFPFVYMGPSKTAILPPEWPQNAGKLLPNCLKVIHSPIITIKIDENKI